MKTIKTTIYECEFCKKYYRRKHFAISHELKCKKNPDNHRPCYGCLNLEKQQLSIEDGHSGYRVSLLFCKKKDEFIYPPQCDIKNNVVDIGENYPMPKKCTDADYGCADDDLTNVF